MILVLLGTQDKPFNRILDSVSSAKKKGLIKEKVVAQVGCTKYDGDEIETFDFVSKDELQKLMNEANLIITHAGVGTIIECLKKDKKIIVVPRLKKYKEHTNDHQIQITDEFAVNGYVLPLYDGDNLEDILNKIKDFKPKKYESNTEKFKDSIKNYIELI